MKTRQSPSLLICLASTIVLGNGFTPVAILPRSTPRLHSQPTAFRLYATEPQVSDDITASSATEDTTESSVTIPESPMDAAMREQQEKIRRSDELRAQEVFIKRATGKHKCTNCDWEYDETKGDVVVIGGTIQPGTAFADLPSNWRCPTCRASKDKFEEVVEEIPGFEVNQGYGFGGNGLTGGQKTGLVFGGLGLCFLFLMSGYLMS